MTTRALTSFPNYAKILSKFPQNFSFCFAYGSGVKKQLNDAIKPQNENMIDLIYCVENSYRWHEANLKLHEKHYSFLRHFGHNLVAKFQESSGAKVYYNTLVDLDGTLIKYGVISTKDLITDLLDWCDLYLAGRLHKPVEIIKNPSNSQLQTALQINLRSAVHAALLLLPETFSEYDFYYTISSLSYNGDFRMTFGENKNKIENIVKPQLAEFRNIYLPIMKSLKEYVDFPIVVTNPPSDSKRLQYFVDCSQDAHPLTKLHHLNQLPKCPQKGLVRFWNKGSLRQDTEDVLRAVAYDPDCNKVVGQCIRNIVWNSSVKQSLKGILTAGMKKTVIYGGKKIIKMIK